MPVFSDALLVVLAISAMVEDLSEVHRWTAHYYLIYLWLAVPIASAILLYQKVFDRPLAAFSQCVVLGSLIAIALLAGFTGYLPAQINDLSSETYRRFVLLHGFILPGLLVFGQCLWLWFAWPCGQTLSKQGLER